MKRIALIGGTGADRLVSPGACELPCAVTRWGEPSRPLLGWREGRVDVLFLARHGARHTLAPHLVNYRANIEALRAAQADALIGINAVGGIGPEVAPGRIVLPRQLIDYTWGRAQTFADGVATPLRHVEFDPPFDEPLRAALLRAAVTAGVDVAADGTYGVTQGPRLETAAEIDRLARDGCDIVGMTAMPEAALAREAGMPYAICAVVVNRAAGRQPPGGSIHADLERHVDGAMSCVRRLLDAFFAAI